MTSSYKYNSDNIFGYGPPSEQGKIPFHPPESDKRCETAYWVWGDLSSKIPPLIIVHGGPGAPGREWQAMSLLNDKYGIPVIIYDQIGCGESTRLPELKGDANFWNHDLFTAELANVIKYFKLEKYSLLGHSCGTMITVPYALTQPKGLYKMIIASTSASEQLRAQGIKRRVEEQPQDLRDVLMKGMDSGETDSLEYQKADKVLMKYSMCRMDPWPREMDEVMELMSGDDTIPSTLYGGKPLEPTGPYSKYNVVDRLREITETTAPGGVLLTNGKYDMSSDAGLMPFFTQVRARVKWVHFAESAHFPHIEEHQTYLTALGEFLKVE